MRGSTPLDVAASSVMDNNGLALALEEPDLDKVSLSPLILLSFVLSFSYCTVYTLDLEKKSIEIEGLHMHILF